MLPNRFKKGDTIGIITPSKPLSNADKDYLDNFIVKMKQIGLNVSVAESVIKNIGLKAKYTSHIERAKDLNCMFLDKGIDAIWCFQGGDSVNGILEHIDYEIVSQNPKILLGKSDIDILLLAFNKKTGLITFHGCDSKIGNGKEFDFSYTENSFRERLFLGNKSISESGKPWETIVEGKAIGKILGCNLTSLLRLAGTEYFPDFQGAILFIETYKSTDWLLIPQLDQLEQLKVFTMVKGIVIGSNFGFESTKFTVEEIVKNFTKRYSLPILKINEFGHYQPHAFIPIGAKIELNATKKTIKIMNNFIK